MKPPANFRNPSAIYFRILPAAAAGVLLLCLAAASSPGQTYTILHTFGTNVMGLNPHAPLVQGTDGALYGATEQGGSANRGQVFKVNPDGSGYTALKDFTGADGAYPEAGLLLSGSTLYGTTANGGTNDNGTVFKLNTDGSGFVVLHMLAGSGMEGVNPIASLALSGTTLYGTAANGGWFGNGTVFKLDTDGSGYTVLKQFLGNDGAYPYGALVLSDTTLYGTTVNGGGYGNGTVFKVNTDGSGYSVLKNLNGGNDGGYLYAGLVLSGTNLFGTAAGGGNSGNGTVFKLNTDGSGFAVIKDFADNTQGANPNAGLLLSATTLYGTTAGGGTSGNGTVFKVNTDGSTFTVLKDFTNSPDGAYSQAGLMLSGTTLFGTTYNGGNNGWGTVFKVETDGSGYAVVTHFVGGDGVNPYGSLALDGTTLYGTTSGGGESGSGTLFKVNADGSGYTVLKDFTNSLEGMNPNGGLVLSGTTLFGTANGGSSGNGVVFKVNTDGSGYTVLKDFTNSTDGAYPNTGLSLSGTTLYGTTGGGGSNGDGAVFKIDTDGTGFESLHSFSTTVWSSSGYTNADGAWPQAGLISSGTTLYGTTYEGGSGGGGTVFEVSTDGSGFTVLKHFTGTDGANAAGGLVLSGTTLCGTTSGGGSAGYGTVFKVSTDGTGFAVLKNFTASDGAGPQMDLLLSGTTLYGTASWGGIVGYGTVFQIDTDGSAFAVLKHFTSSDGGYPHAGLALLGTTLYGTASGGGGLDSGVLFSLSVLPGAPGIQMQPQSQTVQAGASANLLVVASPMPTPAYQWFFNGNAISDATNYSLELPGIQRSQAGAYLVVVTNSYGSVTSLVATLTVEDPFINNQPYSQYVRAGDTVQFNVDAGGTPPLSYQWFKDGVSLSDIGNISGAQTLTLTLANASVSDGGSFFFVISNAYGSVTSVVATLIVQDPFINSQPFDQFVNAGSTVELSVDAGGTPPLSCQWFKDGVSLGDIGNISGAQTLTLTLTNVSGGDGGAFFFVISNAYGSVTSIVATLIVQDPFINNQLYDQFANAGETTRFTLDAGGTPPLSYQWFKDGVSLSDGGNISGAQTSTLTLSNVLSADAGGYWLVVSNAYGTVASVAAHLTVNFATMDSFNPVADGGVYCLAAQAGGKILVGGDFSTLGGQVRNRIGRLNADGTLDAAFDPGANSDVNSLAVQADGRILLGGWFHTLGGQTRNFLARLNANGTLDTTFNPGADSGVRALAVQRDGKILVGGDFSTLGGQVRNYLGRLNADGTLDTSFNPGADGEVDSLILEADAKILVGGWFNTLGGQTRNHLGRLNVDGTLDTTFNPGASDGVSSLAVLPDGKILVAGWFTTLGGQTCNRIARLNADGTLDTSFNPGADGEVDSLAVQADGKILAGGFFATLDGEPRENIGRLFADGSLDTTFTPWTDNNVLALAVQPDGKILLGGWFGMLAGHTRNNLGRVNNTEPATQELSFDGSTIIWLRGGASAEVWRTTFEVSTNGSDWSNLGDGIRVSGGWQLSGLSVPASANIRARGLVAPDGRSSWFVEAMLGPPVIVGQPQNFTSDAGKVAQFNVVAEGTPPLIYQWLKDGLALIDGGNISGAQTATLTLSNLFGADAGGYSMVVSNTFGTVTSLVATLTVMDPFISFQPESQFVLLGQRARFDVVAGGTPPLSYQWRREGTILPGATLPSLILPSTQVADAGGYDLVVTNIYGSVTSSLASLTVVELPPTGTVAIGGSPYAPVGTPEVVFVPFLSAEGGATRNTYSGFVQLRVAGSGESRSTSLNDAFYIYTDDAHNPAVPSNDADYYQLAVDSTLIFAPTDRSDDARNYVIYDLNASTEVQPPYVPPYRSDHVYDLIINANLLRSGGLPAALHFGVADAAFGGNSGSYLVVVQQLAPASGPPVVLQNPLSQTVDAGSSTTFSLLAGGAPPLSFQWFKGALTLSDGQDISGALTPTLTLSNLTAAEVGGYRVVVTNAYGRATSAVAALTVIIGADLLANGDFEAGNVGFTSDYRYSPRDIMPEGTYDIVTDPHNSHPGGASFGDHTTGHGLMLALNGSPNTNDLVWREVVNVAPGNTYQLSAWAATWGNSGQGYDPSPPLLRVLINGQPQGSDLQMQAPNGKWQCFSILWSSEVSTRAEIGIYDLNADGFGNDFVLDDLQFVMVAPSAATIVQDPEDQAGTAGGSVRFTVVATGTPPLSYQWLKDGLQLNDAANISGVTTPALTLAQVSGANVGGYSVVVTNVYGAVTSAVASLSVQDPFISSQPVSQSVQAEQTVQFNVAAAGTPPLSYQWLKNGAILIDGGNISGAHTPTLTLNNVLGGDRGGYSVVISNAYGSVTSVVATLTVADPFIIAQPVSQSATAGATVQFSVVAGGTAPFTYQWLKNGVSLNDGGNTYGAQTATLTLSGVVGADEGGYSVIVSNIFGTVTSQVATLSEGAAVIFWSQWSSAISGVPGSAAAEISALGIDISYHGEVQNLNSYYPSWQPATTFSGGMVPNPPTSSGGIIQLTGGNAGVNTITFSKPVVDPVMAIWSLGASYLPNISFVFQTTNVITIESGGPSYEFGGTSITQIGNTIYGTEGNGTIRFHGTFTQVSWINPSFENWFGFTVGVSAVAKPPTVQILPSSQTAEIGSAVAFTATASGSPPLDYQWYFNGANTLGCTNSCLQLTNVQFSQSGTYAAVVTNAAGGVTSAPAMLKVIAAVGRRSVPGIKVMGEAGSTLNVQYTAALDPAPTWDTLDSLTLTNTSQFCFDVSEPLPPQRFYRAWQSGTPGVVPSLSLPGMVPAITLTGNVGDTLRVDYINQFGPTDAWVTLGTVTLTNTSQLYFDVTAPGQPARLYRIVPVP